MMESSHRPEEALILEWRKFESLDSIYLEKMDKWNLHRPRKEEEAPWIFSQPKQLKCF